MIAVRVTAVRAIARSGDLRRKLHVALAGDRLIVKATTRWPSVPKLRPRKLRWRRSRVGCQMGPKYDQSRPVLQLLTPRATATATNAQMYISPLPVAALRRSHVQHLSAVLPARVHVLATRIDSTTTTTTDVDMNRTRVALLRRRRSERPRQNFYWNKLRSAAIASSAPTQPTFQHERPSNAKAPSDLVAFAVAALTTASDSVGPSRRCRSARHGAKSTLVAQLCDGSSVGTDTTTTRTTASRWRWWFRRRPMFRCNSRIPGVSSQNLTAADLPPVRSQRIGPGNGRRSAWIVLRPTPPWPSHTDQFGYYYVRSPW